MSEAYSIESMAVVFQEFGLLNGPSLGNENIQERHTDKESNDAPKHALIWGALTEIIIHISRSFHLLQFYPSMNPEII